jgi:hypothetical protein
MEDWIINDLTPFFGMKKKGGYKIIRDVACKTASFQVKLVVSSSIEETDFKLCLSIQIIT